MKDTFAIKENRTFQRIYKRGAHKAMRHITVYAFKNQPGKDGRIEGTHLGITVSKKFGNSVQRNYFKRVVRENFRDAALYFDESYNVVVVARPSQRTATTPKRKLRAESVPSFDEIRSELFQALYALKIIHIEG